MIPNPKDPQFIRHDVPDGASKNLLHLYEEYQTIQRLAQQGNWRGVQPDNFSFEYSTYDGNTDILFNFIDKNQHVHEITVTFYDDSTSNACWFSYLFKADNFDEQVLCVQSFAEFLMIQLCDNGIDANLCKFNWGLEFKSSIDSVVQHMDLLITAIITSIKPMEWFYSKEPIRRFYHIHCHLMQILPHIKQEAEKGRWKGVEPNNFIILHDNTQAYIVLTYQEAGIYDMSFKIGLSENGFDEDVSGEWFTCEYKFDIRTSDKELSDYYLAEEKTYCKTVSAILDMISYNFLFAPNDNNTGLTLVVNRDRAFQKYCLMLDVMLPILFKHKALKPLVTKSTLEQKALLESILNTKMDIVEDPDSKHIFDKGIFLPEPEDPNIIYNEEIPF